MSDAVLPWERFAVMVKLTEKTSAELGRTALMKYVYFLQTLRRVPLGYNFRLYAYGPFDSRVLDDLDYAEMLDAVQVKPLVYPTGYGYNIRPGVAAEEFKTRASKFLNQYQDDIDWVIQEFGSLSAAQLELASTMIFADREALRSGKQLTLDELTRRVRELKPRFSQQEAYAQAESLINKRLLRAVQA